LSLYLSRQTSIKSYPLKHRHNLYYTIIPS
jgi:hypothetical protein